MIDGTGLCLCRLKWRRQVKKLLVAMLLFPGMTLASPWLICDPYPNTGPQPTEFVVNISGITAPIVTPAVDVTGGKAMKLDLGPLNLVGAKTVTAKARSPYGESANSAPFSFTAGAPASPTGLTLSAQ
jgi:hypothetical protein